MADRKKDEPPVNEARRSMFRLFTRPLAALAPVEAKPAAPKPAAGPPRVRKVLRDDIRAPFLALIDTFASGIPLAGGFRVLGVQFGRDAVEVRWQRPREGFVTVFVAADRELDVGASQSVVAGSVRIVATGGNAPPESVATALSILATEVARNDKGHLWIEVPADDP